MSPPETSETAPKPVIVKPPITRFDKNVLALRREWSATDIAAGYAWRRTSGNESSDSRPFNVVDDKSGQTGKAKPGDTNLSDVSRAAHEKIVADLAAVEGLDLAVPPVTLYDRADTAKGDRLNEKGEKVDSPRYIAVSAWAFKSCDPLNQRLGSLTAEQKNSLVAPFSAMSVFENWISANDLKLDHVLIDNELGERPGVAWIDNAFSLSYVWEGNPNVGGSLRWYLTGVSADRDIQMVTIEKITSVSDDQIREIVNRIKPEWLSTGRRDLIIRKLIERRDGLQKLCGLE